MLDEENDKRIKDAADQYHPEYEDIAWNKMEQLLDEHLPVEKERKRFFFLIPLLLIIGAGMLLVGLYNWKNKNTESNNNVSKNKTEKTIVKKAQPDTKKITTATISKSINPIATITVEKKIIETNNTKSIQKRSVTTGTVSSLMNDQNENTLAASHPDLLQKQIEQMKQQVIEKSNNSAARSGEVVSTLKNTSQENNNEGKAGTEKEIQVDSKKSLPQKETTEQVAVTKTENASSENISKKTNKASHSFAGNFGVSISAGPDISAVDANKIGKVTVAYGGGFSYAVSKKLTVRTGFYLSKKIYSVNGYDYKMPAGSIGNYQYLQNVDANCKVYEIPIRIDYSFRKTKNHNWFISGGLSSYLMKRETYNYYYKTPSGQIYNKDWSISNKNKHFLSVLDISGGYQYSLNNQFAIVAEPYVNVPLTGIGAGKVKLNSGGILFTIKVKPFLKH
jgi:hypothetical protein